MFQSLRNLPPSRSFPAVSAESGGIVGDRRGADSGAGGRKPWFVRLHLVYLLGLAVFVSYLLALYLNVRFQLYKRLFSASAGSQRRL